MPELQNINILVNFTAKSGDIMTRETLGWDFPIQPIYFTQRYISKQKRCKYNIELVIESAVRSSVPLQQTATAFSLLKDSFHTSPMIRTGQRKELNSIQVALLILFHQFISCTIFFSALCISINVLLYTGGERLKIAEKNIWIPYIKSQKH